MRNKKLQSHTLFQTINLNQDGNIKTKDGRSGPRKKVSPKGKRKLTFPSKKPGLLNGKRFYLDLVGQGKIKIVQHSILDLGGTVEEFVSKEVYCIITDRVSVDEVIASNKKGSHTPFLGPYPSPLPQLSSNKCYANSPLSTDSPQSFEVKTLNATRGKTFLKHVAATQRQGSTNLLENARKWNVKDSDKQKSKYLQTNGSFKVKFLKSPFIKVEDQSRKYRPVYLEMDQWPTLHFESNPGACPFEKPKRKKELAEANEENHSNEAETDNCSQDVSNKPSESPRNKKDENKGGYCECCKVRFTSLKQHLKGDQHRAYATNETNYAELDSIISCGNSFDQFLSSIAQKYDATSSNANEGRSGCSQLADGDMLSTMKSNSICSERVEISVTEDEVISKKTCIVQKEEPVANVSKMDAISEMKREEKDAINDQDSVATSKENDQLESDIDNETMPHVDEEMQRNANSQQLETCVRIAECVYNEDQQENVGDQNCLKGQNEAGTVHEQIQDETPCSQNKLDFVCDQKETETLDEQSCSKQSETIEEVCDINFMVKNDQNDDVSTCDIQPEIIGNKNTSGTSWNGNNQENVCNRSQLELIGEKNMLQATDEQKLLGDITESEAIWCEKTDEGIHEEVKDTPACDTNIEADKVDNQPLNNGLSDQKLSKNNTESRELGVGDEGKAIADLIVRKRKRTTPMIITSSSPPSETCESDFDGDVLNMIDRKQDDQLDVKTIKQRKLQSCSDKDDKKANETRRPSINAEVNRRSSPRLRNAKLNCSAKTRQPMKRCGRLSLPNNARLNSRFFSPLQSRFGNEKRFCSESDRDTRVKRMRKMRGVEFRGKYTGFQGYSGSSTQSEGEESRQKDICTVDDVKYSGSSTVDLDTGQGNVDKLAGSQNTTNSKDNSKEITLVSIESPISHESKPSRNSSLCLDVLISQPKVSPELQSKTKSHARVQGLIRPKETKARCISNVQVPSAVEMGCVFSSPVSESEYKSKVDDIISALQFPCENARYVANCKKSLSLSSFEDLTAIKDNRDVIFESSMHERVKVRKRQASIAAGERCIKQLAKSVNQRKNDSSKTSRQASCLPLDKAVGNQIPDLSGLKQGDNAKSAVASNDDLISQRLASTPNTSRSNRTKRLTSRIQQDVTLRTTPVKQKLLSKVVPLDAGINSPILPIDTSITSRSPNGSILTDSPSSLNSSNPVSLSYSKAFLSSKRVRSKKISTTQAGPESVMKGRQKFIEANLPSARHQLAQRSRQKPTNSFEFSEDDFNDV
eukprot:gene3315-3800_t